MVKDFVGSAGLVDLLVDGNTEATDQGDGGTTGAVTVTMAGGRDVTFNQDKLSTEDIAFLKEKGDIAPSSATSGGGSSGAAGIKELPDELPDPDGEEADMSKPVQDYILLVQSNMLFRLFIWEQLIIFQNPLIRKN